jgi:hypothetical protein
MLLAIVLAFSLEFVLVKNANVKRAKSVSVRLTVEPIDDKIVKMRIIACFIGTVIGSLLLVGLNYVVAGQMYPPIQAIMPQEYITGKSIYLMGEGETLWILSSALSVDKERKIWVSRMAIGIYEPEETPRLKIKKVNQHFEVKMYSDQKFSWYITEPPKHSSLPVKMFYVQEMRVEND